MTRPSRKVAQSNVHPSQMKNKELLRPFVKCLRWGSARIAVCRPSTLNVRQHLLSAFVSGDLSGEGFTQRITFRTQSDFSKLLVPFWGPTRDVAEFGQSS